jgi:hypothetical protein
MGVLVGIIAALAAGKTLAAIAAGLTLTNWIALGEVGVTGTKVEIQIVKALMAHRKVVVPHSGPSHSRTTRPHSYEGGAVYCFQHPTNGIIHICRTTQ